MIGGSGCLTVCWSVDCGVWSISAVCDVDWSVVMGAFGSDAVVDACWVGVVEWTAEWVSIEHGGTDGSAPVVGAAVPGVAVDMLDDASTEAPISNVSVFTWPSCVVSFVSGVLVLVGCELPAAYTSVAAVE